MTSIATQKMAFEEFIRIADEDAGYELVDGQLERLMAPQMRHSEVQRLLAGCLEDYLGEDFEGFLGTELDFPTIPLFGRRGDIVYLSPEHVTPEDWERGYPLHPPDLVIEVVSEGDEGRDYVDKRREYALIGVPHYWIADPARQTIEMLVLREDGSYSTARLLGRDDTLAAPLFPGLSIPLRRIFRAGGSGGSRPEPAAGR